MLPSSGGLDDQLQAFHAQDGYAVASREEHLRDETHSYQHYKLPLAKSDLQYVYFLL